MWGTVSELNLLGGLHWTRVHHLWPQALQGLYHKRWSRRSCRRSRRWNTRWSSAGGTPRWPWLKGASTSSCGWWRRSSTTATISMSSWDRHISKSSALNFAEHHLWTWGDFEDKFNKEMEKFKKIWHYAGCNSGPRRWSSGEGRQDLSAWKDSQGCWVHRLNPTTLLWGYSSGRFCFEVQVEEKTRWAIGVAREPVDRKKWFPASEHGYRRTAGRWL